MCTPRFRLGMVLGLMLTHSLSAASSTGKPNPVVQHRKVNVATEVPVPSPSSWTAQPPFPLSPGMGGIIAGTHHGVLIAAGGANFPDRMPWDGGAKVYHDEIFVHVPGEASWRAAGRLPERCAYAAVVSTEMGVLVLGGENAEGVRTQSWLLKWEDDTVRVEQAIALPASRTSAVAVVIADRVFVAGGYSVDSGAARTSTGDFWCLDLKNTAAGWQTLPSWPGPPRAQAVIAALDGALYLLSGLKLELDGAGNTKATYLTDAYRFRGDTWERLPDLPWSAVGAPSPAPVTTGPSRVFVLGGVDGRLVGKTPRDTRVPGDILCFDATAHSWRWWTERWPDPVVTAPTVPLGGEWWIVSGEIMAGVRTTSVWSWRPGKTK